MVYRVCFISRSHEEPPHPGMESIFFEPRLFVCSRMLLLPWGAREEIFFCGYVFFASLHKDFAVS